MGCAQVLRLIRMELFRTLLMERVEFFDRCALNCPRGRSCPYWAGQCALNSVWACLAERVMQCCCSMMF